MRSSHTHPLVAKITKAIEYITIFLIANSHPDLNEDLKDAINILTTLKSLALTSNETEVSRHLDNLLQTIVEVESDEDLPQDVRKLIHTVYEELTKLSFEHPHFSKPSSKISMQNFKLEKMNRICFRGDDRDPSIIFREGFIPKKEPSHLRVIYNHYPNTNKDIAISDTFDSTQNVIAVSTRFVVTPLFPYDVNVDETWLYTLKVEEGFNTHAHGYLASKDLMRLDKMFVDEINVLTIPPANIIAAVQVKRGGSDLPIGYYQPFAEINEHIGKYYLGKIIVNSQCKVPISEIQLALRFLKKEVRLNKENQGQHIPFSYTAYHVNSMFKRTTQQQAAAKIIQEAKVTITEIEALSSELKKHITDHANAVILLINQGKFTFSTLVTLNDTCRDLLFSQVDDVINFTKSIPHLFVNGLESKDWITLFTNPTSEESLEILNQLSPPTPN